MRKIYILIFTIALAFVASPVYAANLTVIFENAPLPLFGEVNFLPGDSKDGDVEVNNGTGATQSVYAESVNGSDPDGLGSQLNLTVFEDGSPLLGFPMTFSNFLSAGPVSLSSLGAGATTTYTFEVSFIDSADNDYMGKSLGFDLCIGFSGGTFQCGDTVIGGEEDTDGGGGGGGGGGSIPGTGGGPTTLTIFGEQTADINPLDGSAVITWDTNLLSTSQVIYGLASDGLYVLDVVDPINPLGSFFGYPLGTAEDPIKVLNHSVELTGLMPGETYLYRVVSRASPPTVSFEHKFTVPILAQGGPVGTVLGASTQGGLGGASFGVEGGDGVDGGDDNAITSTTSPTSTTTRSISQVAAVALSGFDLTCIGIALIIFLVILALNWYLFKDRREKYKYRALPSVLLVVFGLVVSVILWFIPYTCPLLPLWVLIAGYIIWRIWTDKVGESDN